VRQPQIKYTENADNACDGYAHHETQQTRNSNQSKTDLCGIKVLDTLFFFYQELVMPIDMVLDTTLKVIMVIVIIYLAVFNNYSTLQRNRKK